MQAYKHETARISGKQWYDEAVFYHIYALGMLGAERFNDFSTPKNRLSTLHKLIPYLKDLGVNAVLIGPIFESLRHGYDSVDYFKIDQRLGESGDFKRWVHACHEAGIRVILDAVFNHVGRGFWAFRDLQEKRQASPYKDFFCNVNFGAQNANRDGFTYETWEGHEELVKLNLRNDALISHLFAAVEHWMNEYQIDGLRLDAADCLDPQFIKQLRAFTKSRRSDFYLLGEVIHGDYRKWANPEMLDATTNYEAYKGLWSSHNDANYHEIAWTLRREFEENTGIYEGLAMLNFLDNHDVDRIASKLNDGRDIFPCFALLFTMPGTPCIYYASEWGVYAKKGRGYEADDQIRAQALPQTLSEGCVGSCISQSRNLKDAISRLAKIRNGYFALTHGSYHQIAVSAQTLIFSRKCEKQSIICAVSGEENERIVTIDVEPGRYIDILNGGQCDAFNAKMTFPLYAKWIRIWLKVA